MLAAVLVALTALLSRSSHVALAQPCTRLLADIGAASDYLQHMTYVSANNVVFSRVALSSPTSIGAHSTFLFRYTMPNQRGLQLPSQLRFAVYNNENNRTDIPDLVAQSELVTVETISGRQSFLVKAQSGAQPLVRNATYVIGGATDKHTAAPLLHVTSLSSPYAYTSRLTCSCYCLSIAAIWNEHRVQYFYKPQKFHSELVSLSYDASAGFPAGCGDATRTPTSSFLPRMKAAPSSSLATSRSLVSTVSGSW